MLPQSEIGGGKAICRHLSILAALVDDAHEENRYECDYQVHLAFRGEQSHVLTTHPQKLCYLVADQQHHHDRPQHLCFGRKFHHLTLRHDSSDCE